MKLSIKINMENAAFRPEYNSTAGYEVARILELLAARLDGELLDIVGPVCKLIDVNGNVVGEAKVTR